MIKNSLIVRSYSGDPTEPDTIHTESLGSPILPGTSMKGAIRTRAERIINTLGKSSAIIDELCGFVDESAKKARPSRVTINETLLPRAFITEVSIRDTDKDQGKQLELYDSKDNTAIRGYKLYWHRDARDWIESEKQIKDHVSQYTKITPVKKGTTFKGRIRFENLSEVELGALPFVLDCSKGLPTSLAWENPLDLAL